MLIAFDAELFYDEVPSPGMVELLLGLYTMNVDNRIIVWSDKGEKEARRLAKMGGLLLNPIAGYGAGRQDLFEFEDKMGFQEPVDIHFNKRGKIGKGKTVVTSH